MKKDDKVKVTVEPFLGETGVIHKVYETAPLGMPENWCIGVILDTNAKWNHKEPMMFHTDELEVV